MTDQHTFTPQGPGAYSSAGAPHAPAPPPGAPHAPTAPPAGPHAPAPKKRSWFARHKILTALLAVVALVIAVNLGGGGDDEETSTPGGSVDAQPPVAADDAAPAAEEAEPAAEDAEPAAEEPDPAADLPGIGEPVRDGMFEFTVTQVETGVTEVGDEFLNEQAQGQYVLVHITVTNIGDRAQSLFGDNQTLVDTEGREHSADSTAALYLDSADTFFSEINPGNSVGGVVVFDIPADAVPAAIELHDSMFSGGVTVSLQQ